MGHPDSEKVASQGTSAYNNVVTHDTVSALRLAQPPANTLSLFKTHSEGTIAAHRVTTLRIGPELGSHPVVGDAVPVAGFYSRSYSSNQSGDSYAGSESPSMYVVASQGTSASAGVARDTVSVVGLSYTQLTHSVCPRL